MPEQVGYYAAPAMLGGPVPGRPSYVLPQAPSVGSWPLPPATTRMVPGMAPPPATLPEEPTKVVREGVARARWNRDEEERLKKTRGSRRPSTVPSLHLIRLVSISRDCSDFAPRRSGSTVPSATSMNKQKILGSGRTASGVEQHWQVMTGQRQRSGHRSQGKPGAASQRAAGRRAEGRPADRTTRRKRARWTQDEENRLREAVSELGKGKWTLVADRPSGAPNIDLIPVGGRALTLADRHRSKKVQR